LEIKLAESAGFCFGVSRAVEAVYQALREHPDEAVYTYGPIVHNDQVIAELARLGVRVIPDAAELEKMLREGKLDGAVLVIRAHGISDGEMKMLSQGADLKLVDATCPFVEKIHEVVRRESGEGRKIIVAGDPEHPEVKGIVGCSKTEAAVIRTPEEARQFHAGEGEKLTLVSQTTFQTRKFNDIVDIFKKKLYDVHIVNTICNATQRRQSEAAELSGECDLMLVIGAKNSSNTSKLFEICLSACPETYYIQCLEDLSRVAIVNSVRCIGITAGASTPKTIIEEVLNYVRTEFWRYA